MIKQATKKANEAVTEVKEMLDNKSFALELLSNFKQSNKRIFIISIVVIACFITSIFSFLYMLDRQQAEYLKVINKQQEDFIDFLSQYDFEAYELSGDGVNYFNKNVGGDANNGIASKREK